MKFFRQSFRLLIFLSFPACIFSQTKKVDSLFVVLKTANDDSNKVVILNDLAWQLKSNEPEQALEYANQALQLAQKILKTSSADEGIRIKSRIGVSHRAIGLVYSYQGNYEKALGHYLQALQAWEEIDYKQGIANAYINLGNLYVTQKNFDKALEYHLASLKKWEEINDKAGIAMACNNIGAVYHHQNNLEKALEYYQKSLHIKEEIGDKRGIAGSFANIGAAYLEKGEADKTLEYFLKSMKILQELGDKWGIATTYNNIGELNIQMGNYDDAIASYYNGLQILQAIGNKEGIVASYQGLSESYSKKKDFNNAYEFHKKYSEIKDSILNEESSKQITEMQTKYETEKKEQQITLLNKDKELQDAQLNRQKIIIWSVAGGLLVVLTLSIFIFRERKKSEKLLLNILPAETAKELKRNGKATAKHYESVTVMFTDFKGFTNIAEKLSAEELVSELDFLFKKFDEIISKYNIEKIKTIGDAYMCASGLPTPNSNHAEEIVKAGIEIQSWMKEQNNKWSLRMGIHSGSVTAGVVGDKKFAYDIWGDTVNTASRMESSGEAGKINISGSTYASVKDKFTCEFRGKISAKNKGEIDMYFVERAI